MVGWIDGQSVTSFAFRCQKSLYFSIRKSSGRSYFDVAGALGALYVLNVLDLLNVLDMPIAQEDIVGC